MPVELVKPNYILNSLQLKATGSCHCLGSTGKVTQHLGRQWGVNRKLRWRLLLKRHSDRHPKNLTEHNLVQNVEVSMQSNKTTRENTLQK